LYYITDHNMFRPLWVIIRCHLLHAHNYHTAAHVQVFLQFGKINLIKLTMISLTSVLKLQYLLKFYNIYLHLYVSSYLVFVKLNTNSFLKISTCFYIVLHVEHSNIILDCRFYVELECNVAFVLVVRLSFLGHMFFMFLQCSLSCRSTFDVVLYQNSTYSSDQ
jgi:hypothetical protein